jgi:hypothetical protein
MTFLGSTIPDQKSERVAYHLSGISTLNLNHCHVASYVLEIFYDEAG